MQSFTAMAEEEKQSKQLVMKAHARALQCPPNKSTSLKKTQQDLESTLSSMLP